MRVIALATASLLSGLFHPTTPTTTTKVYAQGEWRLTVVADTFTNQVRCRLENRNGVRPDVLVVPGGLALRPGGADLDVSDGWYKIEGRPARRWGDLRAQLVAAGSLVEAERLDSRSGGWITLPLDEIRAAPAITLWVSGRARLKSIKLTDAWSALASAQSLKCSFDKVV